MRAYRAATLVVLLSPWAAPAGEAGWVSALASVRTVQRLDLPAAGEPYRFHLFALRRFVEIEVGGNAARVERELARLASGAAHCNRVERIRKTVRLHCQSARLHLVRRGPRAVEIIVLRGLPWRGTLDGPPRAAPNPHGARVGSCPGATPVARGECLLEADDRAGAEAAYRAALAEGRSEVAAVRLGDLLLERDALPEAVALFKSVPTSGSWGRLARVRLLELTGEGLEQPLAYDPIALPDGISEELALRWARALAFTGRSGEAARALAHGLIDSGPPRGCALNLLLCRSIALAALEHSGPDDFADAMSVYLSLPGRYRGPLALDLARIASRRAEEIGAYGFAANLLATITPRVPEVELPDHLLRTALLYRRGGDLVRSEVVFDYARSRLGVRATSRGPWKELAVRPAPRNRRPAADASERIDTAVAEAEAALADAVLARARARRVGAPGSTP